MSKSRITSVYHNIGPYLEKPARATARSFSKFDGEDGKGGLVQLVERLDADRKKPRTREQSLIVKNEILDAICALDEAAPIILMDPSTVEYQRGVFRSQKKGGAITALVDKLKYEEHSARFAENAIERKHHTRQSEVLTRQVLSALKERRTQLQKRRPERLDPSDHNAMRDLDISLYEPFIRAMAASARKDLENPNSRYELERLPAICQVAKESIAFCAMLDFTRAAEKIIKECSRHHGRAERFWQEHQPEFKKSLAHAAADFNRTIASLDYRVTAGDPAYSTYRHSQAFVQAEHLLENAGSFQSVKYAHNLLKDMALEFILGGEENQRNKAGAAHAIDHTRPDQPHHKLFRRLKKAYRHEQRAQEVRQDEFEHTHDSDRSVFNNYLDVSLHTLNRVYEARWALADDVLTDILSTNFKTVADPKIAHPSDMPPSDEVTTHVARVTKRSKVTSHAAQVSGNRAQSRAELPPQSAIRQLYEPDNQEPDADNKGWSR